jgi:PTS system mannose-specific IIC component
VTILLAAALLVWGTIVAVDLVSIPQGLLARPLVAATVAGAIAGDVRAGVLVGAVLELYALEILPIGAARYPDYGPAAVAAGAAAALDPAASPIALAGMVGLPMGILGGWTLHAMRRRTARSVEKALARVSAGDARAIWQLQLGGLQRDARRGLMLSAVALLVAFLVHLLPWFSDPRAVYLDWAVLAGGAAAALGGALRIAGAGARQRWLVVGLATGILVAVWP